MKKLIIVGLGEKAKEVKSFTERFNLFEIVGFALNKEYIKQNEFENLPVYALEDIDRYFDKKEIFTFVAISQFNYMHRVKRKIFDYLVENDFNIANLISPLATINTDKIGVGNWICDYAYIDEGAKIGSNNVFDKYSYIAHYNEIGNHNFFGIRSLTGGNVTIGDQCFIGLGAIVFNSVIVGNKCIIGAGTVIKKHVGDFCLCKNSGSNIEVYQYGSETIEEKLAPSNVPMKNIRKTYIPLNY